MLKFWEDIEKPAGVSKADVTATNSAYKQNHVDSKHVDVSRAG